FTLPPAGEYGVGTIFLTQDAAGRHACERKFDEVARGYGLKIIGWRDVPVDGRWVGPTPKRSEPRIRQVFVGMDGTVFSRSEFERRLYLLRQVAENVIEFGDLPPQAREDFYICGLSTTRLVYTGMLTAHQL